jgi:hypothetical protein
MQQVPNKKKSVAHIPRANYIDRAVAAVGEFLLLRVEGAA